MLLQKAPTPSELPGWQGWPQNEESIGAQESTTPVSCEVPASVVPPALDELHPAAKMRPNRPISRVGRGMRGVFAHHAAARNSLCVSMIERDHCGVGGTTTVLMGATYAPAGYA
jgi:hypothetical protein